MANIYDGALLTLDSHKFDSQTSASFNLNERSDRKSLIKPKTLQTTPPLCLHNPNDLSATVKQLCKIKDKIKEWAFQWKMSFNPDPSKQAQEVIFTGKVKKVAHLPIFFNNKLVQQVPS